MTYRVPAPSKTLPLLIAASLALFFNNAEAAQGDLSLRFTQDGSILPRRSHQAIDLESVNIERLDVTILHVPESDTLAALQRRDVAVPPEATEIWHGQLAVGGEGRPPRLDQPAITTVDILQLVKQLQNGAYIVDAHEATTGKPRAEIRKLLLISNIGLEAFSGADGIAVQARLLSELNAAQAIDVALIARNNREIARIRTDGDGVARFDRAQVSGMGDDAPAAIFAYGADGEFTSLLLPAHDVSDTRPEAWVVTDKQAYKPGEDIHGLALIRPAAGNAEGALYAQLETPNGDVAEVQKLDASAQIALHAPASSGQWKIRVYRDVAGKASLLGSQAVTVGDAALIAEKTVATAQAQPSIIISPGRRSFQRGEMANISIQPETESDVTIALVDSSVHAITRQHFGKDGGVVQLPVPSDASAGLYVAATAFSMPAPGKPVARSFAMQWIGVDEGAHRTGVRLDTPEKAEASGKLPITVALPDVGDKSGIAMLVGTDAALPAALDPFAFFYGQRPPGAGMADTYGSIIGAPASALNTLLASTPQAASSATAPALFWYGPETVKGAKETTLAGTMPPLPGKDPRLRVSAISWFDDRLGYAETSVAETATGHAKHAPAKQKAATPFAIHAQTLKPDAAVKVKAGQAFLASVDPIVAPLAGDKANGYRFVLPDAADLRGFTASLMTLTDPQTTLRAALIGLELRQQGLPFPRATEIKLLDEVQALAEKPETGMDDLLVAHLILLRSGREGALQLQHWMAGGAKSETMLGAAARLALTDSSLLADAEKSALLEAIDKDETDDLQVQALTLLTLAAGNQQWPPGLAHAVSDQAIKLPTGTPDATSLALKLAETLHRQWGDPKTTITVQGSGADATATVKNIAIRVRFSFG